ncbi:MAG: ATPase domain-containing protein [archaeon]
MVWGFTGDELMPFGIKFAGKTEIEPGSIDEEELEDMKDRHLDAIGDKMEFLPVRVDNFDDSLDAHGIERGSTILVSGGCGTGKSTFCMQSIYHGLEQGEKAVYILFEESAIKLKRHMKNNYGWDFAKYEKQGKFAMLKINPFKIARSVEASLLKQRRALLVQVEQLELPFVPDKIAVDSLSSLSVAFMGNSENYRYYIKHMFDSLNQYDSVNYIISETEQDPGIYSRTGIEEFLGDGVIVLYNVKTGYTRRRAMEILKMRCCNHSKTIMPYSLTDSGIKFEKITKKDKDESLW